VASSHTHASKLVLFAMSIVTFCLSVHFDFDLLLFHRHAVVLTLPAILLRPIKSENNFASNG
jgi:hypothetical protein